MWPPIRRQRRIDVLIMQDKPQPRKLQVQVAVGLDEIKLEDLIREPADPGARMRDTLRTNVPPTIIKPKSV